MARILVIDDERLVRASIAAVLGANGHVVLLAVNGREGLERLDNGNFDLVITDLVMPEMGGIETIRAIRRQWRGVRILAMSGGGRQGGDAGAVAARLDADGELRKPFSNSQLLDEVNRAIG
ncbi:MAG TPA: response regulator [Stellaceae bacterium]|nr:response regulator [Stellaceae bacterium]